MHPAQKKAIFAMIDSVENQLRYVKSMLIMDEVESGQVPTSSNSKPQTKSGPYLAEDEEEELTERLEKERVAAMVEESARIQAEWEMQRRVASSATEIASL